MKIESPEGGEQNIHEKRSSRLAEAAGLLVDPLFTTVLERDENLSEIPPNKTPIFVTPHFSDYDVPIAVRALGRRFADITVADASTHEKFFQSPAGYTGRKIGGEKNFFSIDYTGGRGEGHGIFNPDNFKPMKDSIESGKPLVIASYYDTDYQNRTWKLPDKGGYGAAYLAQIAENSLVVPVGIDIHSEQPFGMGSLDIVEVLKKTRPLTNVKIGEPFTQTKIEGIENLETILKKRRNGVSLTSAERKEFSRLHKELKNKSDEILLNLSKSLPPEKRGNWHG